MAIEVKGRTVVDAFTRDSTRMGANVLGVIVPNTHVFEVMAGGLVPMDIMPVPSD